MRNIKSFAVVILSVILFGACITEFKATLPADENNMLVVSGDIIENTQVDFTLSKTFDLESPNPPAASFDVNATVTIVGSDGSKSSPATSMGKGVYRMNIGSLSSEVEYGLNIEYDGNTYISEKSKPLTTPDIEDITWSQPTEYGNIFINVSTAESSSSSPSYYVWTYQEDWEFLAKNATKLFFNKRLQKVDTLSTFEKYYCWQKNTINKTLVGSTENTISNKLQNKQLLEYASNNDRFLSLYCITLKQKAVTKKAYLYFLNKKTQNEDMGGIFQPQPSDMSGNISCTTNSAKKAIGFVSVLKNVTEKKLFIDRADITRTFEACKGYILNEDIAELASKANMTVTDYIIKNDLEPVGDWSFEKPTVVSMEVVGYAPVICVDCVEAGGTKNKPTWWPNDRK